MQNNNNNNNSNNNAIGQKMKDEKLSSVTVGNGIQGSSVKPIILSDGSPEVVASQMGNVAQQQQHNLHLQVNTAHS
jgi:hypothetical protein